MGTHICEEVLSPNNDYAHLCGRYARYYDNGKWKCGYHNRENHGKRRHREAKKKRAKRLLAIEMHDDLVEALGEIIGHVDNTSSTMTWMDAMEQARATLARARGEK